MHHGGWHIGGWQLQLSFHPLNHKAPSELGQRHSLVTQALHAGGICTHCRSFMANQHRSVLSCGDKERQKEN
eukprot:4635509-Amphidinium_carterae.1